MLDSRVILCHCHCPYPVDEISVLQGAWTDHHSLPTVEALTARVREGVTWAPIPTFVASGTGATMLSPQPLATILQATWVISLFGIARADREGLHEIAPLV